MSWKYEKVETFAKKNSGGRVGVGQIAIPCLPTNVKMPCSSQSKSNQYTCLLIIIFKQLLTITDFKCVEEKRHDASTLWCTVLSVKNT